MSENLFENPEIAPDDETVKLSHLKQWVEDFCVARAWDPFHGAKDLAIGLVTESSELLELFRFKDKSEVESLFATPKGKEAIEDEMADIFFFLLRLAGKYNIDLTQASVRKWKKNKERYPVEEFLGKNHKSSKVL